MKLYGDPEAHLIKHILSLLLVVVMSYWFVLYTCHVINYYFHTSILIRMVLLQHWIKSTRLTRILIYLLSSTFP